jgi:hypothetical protein
MPRDLTSNLLIGPYGLHAAVILGLALFAAFLLIFNMTGFF